MRTKNGLRLAIAAFGFLLSFHVQPARSSVSVTVQPQNPVSFVGSNLTFTAQTTVTAGEVITGFAWSLSTNNQASFFALPGATNSSFALTNIQTTNAGYYFVSVIYNTATNTGSMVASTVSLLTVHDQARLTGQPQSLIRATGTSAAFNVTALGAQPLSYTWRVSGMNLADGGRISGSATSNLVINVLLTSDSGNYDLVLTNLYAAVTSQVATLSVYVPPFVSVQPTNLTIVTGSDAVFTLVPGGSQPLNFQWSENGTNLVDGGRISGSTSNVLTIAAALTNDNGTYTVTFTNPVGSATSAPVTLTVLVPPAITSPTNALSQQGFAFNYLITATGTTPIAFGAQGLPNGLNFSQTNGLISGIPTVSGIFNVTLSASNAAATATTNLLLTLITDVPGITSSLSTNGRQGQVFTYAITASNNPVAFSASGLPPGINLNPVTGVISGPSLLSGTFPITIGAANQFGADNKTLTLNLASAVPVITSPLTASGTENATNFTYTITASNSPTMFGAIGLPTGLTLNTNTGVISGSTIYGGTNNVLIYAANAYGTGSNILSLAIAYAPLQGLIITNVTSAYSSPYLLDFTFSLQDPNAIVGGSAGAAVVRPPELVQALCMEGDLAQQIGVPIPNETAFIVESAMTSKLLKTFFVLDYSYSMFITPGAIDEMQSSVEALIDEEPASAQFGVYEFNADYVPPQLVTGFTSDKILLASDIEGIQSNYVQGNYAGTRFYDALAAALGQFTNTTAGEEHYLVVMSDGYDDSSLLTTNANSPTLPDVIVNLAANNSVKIYCVGFGPGPNTNVLQYLTAGTQGRYYSAATPADLPAQFALLLKDLNSQYLLRWATLQRSAAAFQPMFQVTVGGVTASFNTNFNFLTTTTTNTNSMPFVTNSTTTNLTLVPNYTPTNYAGNVQTGALSLYADSGTNASLVTLRAQYVPRFVREVRVHYRPNYPCVPVLQSTDPGDILAGWSLTQTNDGTNGQWLTITSPSPTNVLTSLPYGIMGDLVRFQFEYQALPSGQQAFAFFTVDNSVYSNLPPSGQSFTLTNTNAFTTNYPPTPPFGTPVPWLASYFPGNTNYAALELSDPNSNGLMVWQDYIAGLNPTNANSKFVVQPMIPPQPGQPPVITFNTVLGRVYRVDTATTLGNWMPLLDNIGGTGSYISVPDNRNLSGVSSVFYRVMVSYH